MENGLNEEIVKATQSSLGKYVKRPALTEKLLKKPPFRFLHDIVTSVLRNTGFFEGLFEEQELVSENVKDRENKILFLTKVITVVGLTLGKTLSIKPSKIVAGQEPEKTNELLQCIALALDQKLSSNDAVRKFKNGDKPQELDKNIKDPTKTSNIINNQELKKDTNKANKLLSSRSNEKPVFNKQNHKEKPVIGPDKTESARSKPKPKQKEDSSKKEKPLKQNQPKIKRNESTHRENEKFRNRNNDNLKESNETKVESTDSNRLNDESLNLDINSTLSAQNNEDTIKIEADNLKTNLVSTPIDDNINLETNKVDKSNSKTVGKTQEIANKKIDLSQDKSAINENVSTSIQENEYEETTRQKNKNELGSMKRNENDVGLAKGAGDNTHVAAARAHGWPPAAAVVAVAGLARPASSRPGAPRARARHQSALPSDHAPTPVNIIAESDHHDPEEDASVMMLSEPSERMEQGERAEQSHLVQQILDAQRSYHQPNENGRPAVRVEWQPPQGVGGGVEAEALLAATGALGRTLGTLGRLGERAPEDLQLMRHEHEQLRAQHHSAAACLHARDTSKKDALIHTRTKLKQLDLDILEKRDKIRELKVLVHKNSARIELLLANGRMQS